MSDFKNKTFLQSIKRSLIGVKTGFRLEKNFKNYIAQYLLFFIYNLLVLHLGVELLFIFLGLGAGVLALEFVNTAIEKVCDFIKDDYSVHIRDIKDMAASAVLVFGLVFYAFEITVTVLKIMN